MVLFLAISTFFELVCIILYAIYFTKLPIGGYDSKKEEQLSNKQLFVENHDYVVGLFYIFVVTLSIFPGFLYENTGTHQLGTCFGANIFYLIVYFGTGGDHCKYPVVLIAMYNVVDFIPIYIPLVPWLKLESRKGLLIAVFSRFLLIPAFYFTAKYGDQGWMILLASFLGLTNGYLTKLKDKKPFGRPKFCHITIPLSKALEMQGKQVDAMVELSKICLLLRIFPPEES
ncbi:Equilibrative nucleotide transporter 5 [Glycine soja]